MADPALAICIYVVIDPHHHPLPIPSLQTRDPRPGVVTWLAQAV